MTGTFVGPLIYIAAVALLGAFAYSVILGDIHRLEVELSRAPPSTAAGRRAPRG